MKRTPKCVCLLVILGMVMAVAVAAVGCGSESTTTTAAPAASITTAATAPTETTAAPTETTEGPTETTTAAPEALKVGLVVWKGWAVGVDVANTAEVMAKVVNDAGGLDVGGTKHMIELISYDSENTQDGAVLAMNRLVFEDGVKYVLNDSTGVEALTAIAEENGVILLAMGVAPALFSPDNRYTFPADGSYASSPAILGWLADTFPDMKRVALAYTDDQMGHMSAQVQTASWQTAGFEVVSTEFFPAGQTDLSAVATKVMAADPEVVWPCGSGPTLSESIVKAVFERGYEGMFAMGNATSAATLLTMVPEAALANYVNYAYDVEFDPALSPVAEAFKAAWVEKNGEWTGPEVSGATFVSCLCTAMQEAASIEPDAVAAVIGGGLEFQSPAGALRMTSATEGGTWTNVGLLAYNVKKIEGGQPVQQGAIALDRMSELFYQLVAPNLFPQP